MQLDRHQICVNPFVWHELELHGRPALANPAVGCGLQPDSRQVLLNASLQGRLDSRENALQSYVFLIFLSLVVMEIHESIVVNLALISLKVDSIDAFV